MLIAIVREDVVHIVPDGCHVAPYGAVTIEGTLAVVLSPAAECFTLSIEILHIDITFVNIETGVVAGEKSGHNSVLTFITTCHII